MKLRWFAGLLWLGLLTEAFLFAPASTPDIGPMIWNMIMMKTQGIEPWVVSVFNSLGIFPMLYACLLLPEPRAQRVPALPFVLGSFGLGAFALFPYFLFRKDSNAPLDVPIDHEKHHAFFAPIKSFFSSKILAVVLLLGALFLLGYGLMNGNVNAYIQMWQKNQLVHIMSFDFLVLSLVCPWVIWQDWHRRGNFSMPVWLLCCIPVLGGAVYLLVRPNK